jgi:hypothetical protein
MAAGTDAHFGAFVFIPAKWASHPVSKELLLLPTAKHNSYFEIGTMSQKKMSALVPLWMRVVKTPCRRLARVRRSITAMTRDISIMLRRMESDLSEKLWSSGSPTMPLSA